MVKVGTISHEDIYGVGSLDTANTEQTTEGKTNPNNPDASGNVRPGKESIFNIQGNILGQPLIVWAALIGLLIGVKYMTEHAGKGK